MSITAKTADTDKTASTHGKTLKRPLVGFLGLGWAGLRRMQHLVREGVIEVAALSDPAPEGVAKAKELAPRAKVAEGLNPMLQMGLDAVVISTPSALHAEQAIAAFEAGLAVFCQKPLARTALETKEAVDAARKANRLLGVDLSYRYVNGMPEIRDRIQSGDIGQVFAADVVFHNAFGPSKPWFYDPVKSGGGCVIDLGIHMVDLALWTLGFPKAVDVSARLYSDGKPFISRTEQVEDYAAAQITTETGSVINLACSWNLQAGQDAVISATFYGTEGGFAMHNVGGTFVDFQTERFQKTQREILTNPIKEWGGLAAELWARRLARDRTFDEEINHIVEVAEVLDRIYSAGTPLLAIS